LYLYLDKEENVIFSQSMIVYLMHIILMNYDTFLLKVFNSGKNFLDQYC